MASQNSMETRTDAGRLGVACLQLAVGAEDNIGRIAHEVSLVAKRFPWVSMVLTSELCGHGPSPDAAEAMPGDSERRLCEAAAEHGLWLVPGSLYEKDGDRIYNTTPVIDPSGQVIARYRKIFPFYPYERTIAAGDEFVVFDVPGAGRFGISICYDMWFPETTRSLVSMGAEVILHPTLTNTVDRDVELAMARSSAATNQCYFLDVNAGGRMGVGRSIACGPGGEVIYEAGSGRDIMAFELDFNYLRRCREAGWHGLGQPLKSFRDSRACFAAYGAGSAPSPALDALGALEVDRKSVV